MCFEPWGRAGTQRVFSLCSATLFEPDFRPPWKAARSSSLSIQPTACVLSGRSRRTLRFKVHFSRATTNSGAHSKARLISESGNWQMALRADSAYSTARALEYAESARKARSEEHTSELQSPM